MTTTSIKPSPKRKRSDPNLSPAPPTLSSPSKLSITTHRIQDLYSPALTPAEDDNTFNPTSYPFPGSAAVKDEDALTVGSGSPRSMVAGQLGELDIHGDFVRRLDFGGVANKRARFRERENDSIPGEGAGEHGDGKTSDMPHGEDSLEEEPVSIMAEGDKMDGNCSKTMRARGPVSSHTSTPRTSSFSSIAPSPESPSPSKLITPASTPLKLRRKKTSSSQVRKKSPPLSSQEEDPLTWHDSEITGHLATDSDDDGYGINGIGFRPTAAVAYQRSLKRKQQVREWMKRAQVEDRKRRGERRRNGAINSGDGGALVNGRRGSESKKGVRFMDGEVPSILDEGAVIELA